jgi:prolyl oligopeptidase
MTRVWGEHRVNWAPDSKAFVISAMDDDPNGDPVSNWRIKYHVMGTGAAMDRIVLQSGRNPTLPFDPHELPDMALDTASDWALTYIGGARPEARICVVRKADLLVPAPVFRCFSTYDDDIQDASVKANTLYLLTKKVTPNGEVVAIDLNNPDATLKDARVVVPEDKTTVLTDLKPARDALYVVRMTRGLNDFSRVDYTTGATTHLAAPYGGSAYAVNTMPSEDGLIYNMDSWAQPSHVFHYDPVQARMVDLNMTAQVPKLYPDVEVVDTDIRSRDGTMVPVTILRHKGMKPDGHALVVLDGYGAYGYSIQPYFDPLTLEWAEAGHVYVYVYVRGGGEKGEAWHLGGKGPLKYKSAEDMIAASEAMVQQHYADFDHIAMSGASAGGILLGDAMTMAPDHFGAVIIHAGMVNPSRLAAESNGPNQYGEFGDATTPTGFAALYNMDPYQHIKKGTHYPPLMLEVGLNDNRVPPSNSGKFGAAILAAGTDAQPNDVLFSTEGDSGHFGTSLNQAAAQIANHYTFLEMEMMPARSVAPRHRHIKTK